MLADVYEGIAQAYSYEYHDLFYIFFAILVGLFIFKIFVKRSTRATFKYTTPPPDANENIIVIGAGVVGSTLAISLARDGRKVTVIERDLSEPDRIVGELLQPGGVELMKKLNLENCFEGIDSAKVNGYAVLYQGKEVLLNYPEIKDSNGKKFAPIGRSFHHGRFIQNLRAEVMKEKNITVIEGSVSELLYDEKNANKVIGVKYQQENQQREMLSRVVVVTDGVFSRFRKEITNAKPIVNSSFVGLVLSNIDLPYPGRGHVILADPSPILCYPISSTCVRILVDVPHPLPDSTNGDLHDFLRNVSAPQMPPSIRDAFLKELECSRVRSMPCSRLHPDHYDKDGVLLIGDGWNLRHPLTGGGMTVGFTDVLILRDLFRTTNITDDESFRKMRKSFFNQRVSKVATINILAEALYRVFSNYDYGLLPMREAAFAYFKLGGEPVRGTTALLGCLDTNPWVLISHFFIVASYGVIRTLLPFPTPSKILQTIRTMYSSVNLLIPLCWKEHLFLPNFDSIFEKSPKIKAI